MRLATLLALTTLATAAATHDAAAFSRKNSPAASSPVSRHFNGIVSRQSQSTDAQRRRVIETSPPVLYPGHKLDGKRPGRWRARP